MAVENPLPRSPEFRRDEVRHRQVGRITVRVRYAETDRMGIAYNAHYLTWFEIGRTEFMRSAGFPYRDMEARGLNLPLGGNRLPAARGGQPTTMCSRSIPGSRTSDPA